MRMAAFLPSPASTVPAMLQPRHPALNSSSPPKALLPRGLRGCWQQPGLVRGPAVLSRDWEG